MGRKGTQQPVPVADVLVDAVSKWEARRLYQHLNCQGTITAGSINDGLSLKSVKNPPLKNRGRY